MDSAYTPLSSALANSVPINHILAWHLITKCIQVSSLQLRASTRYVDSTHRERPAWILVSYITNVTSIYSLPSGAMPVTDALHIGGWMCCKYFFHHGSSFDYAVCSHIYLQSCEACSSWPATANASYGGIMVCLCPARAVNLGKLCCCEQSVLRSTRWGLSCL